MARFGGRWMERLGVWRVGEGWREGGHMEGGGRKERGGHMEGGGRKERGAYGGGGGRW